MPAVMPSILQLFLAVLVVSAAFTDLKSRRIPNWIPASGFAAGVILNTYFHGWAGLTSSLAGALLGAGILMAIYLTGGMGGGDVKLLAAVGAISGPQALLVIFVLTGLFGGIAALAMAAARGRIGQTLARTTGLLAELPGSFARLNWSGIQQRSNRQAPGALRLPYGAVIATGTLVFLFASRTPIG